MTTGYWTAKRNLEASLKQRDAISLERTMLRKHRDLTKVEREYIWARLTEQLVEILAVCREYARIVGMHEGHGVPNPLSLSGWRYEYCA